MGVPPPPAQADPSVRNLAQVFDDENETTTVFAPGVHLPPASPPPVFDDENETTSVFDPSAAGKLRSKSSIPPGQYAVPTRPRNTRPPKLTTEQRAASLSTAPPTVIIQENTPAGTSQRPSVWTASTVWLWGPESSAVRKVALAATVAGLLAGVLIVTAGRGASHDDTAVAIPAASPVVTAPAIERPSEPVAQPQPSGPSGPSEERPPEVTDDKREPARKTASHAKAAARTSPEVAPAAPAFEAKADPVLEEEPAPSAAPPAPPAQDDTLLVNPYSTPYSAPSEFEPPEPAPPSAAPAPKKAEAPARPAVTVPKSQRDCRKPYYLDADGIRRVKPECL